jgi:bacillithiol system protein YtxJ
METPFIEIGNVASLDAFLADSNGSAAVLFKHSNTCGVSSRAYAEMSKMQHPVGLVTVQQARPVSDEIEKRWQVAHETPQVLIIRGGKLVWDASHFSVKSEGVEAALKEIGSEQPVSEA